MSQMPLVYFRDTFPQITTEPTKTLCSREHTWPEADGPNARERVSRLIW